MSASRKKTRQDSRIAKLKARLAEAEETLRAIRDGEVDALVVARPDGDQVFTLESAETTYRFLIEEMNEGTGLLSPVGTVLFANARFAQLAEKPLEQIIGSSWERCFVAAERQRLAELLGRAKTSGVTEEFTLDTETGIGRPVVVSLSSMERHRLKGFSVVVSDLTEHKAAEHALQAANERLESRVKERTAELNRANEELTRAQEELREHADILERAVAERTAELLATNEQLEAFVYSIAHDLRAPLRSMTAFSQILVDDYVTVIAEPAQQMLKRIQASAEFMDKLLLDLLAFGRTARVEMELGPVAVQKAWEAALFQCATEIEQSQAQVETVSPLPAVRAHEATLAQCLVNLLSNSLKFVAPGVHPSVRFWAEDCGGCVRLWVEDNGIGIPARYHERVFRVFERLGGARYPGTGIGLSVVRKGVERMGGKAGLQSEPGKGSRFWIELLKAS